MTTIQSWVWHTKIPEEIAIYKDVPVESFILHLAISSNVCLATTMEKIMRPPKALTSLHYGYSGNPFPNIAAIVPSNFPTLLVLHQASLEEFTIYAHPHQHISGQHPTGDIVATMRNFCALKRLGLPAWWMVHASSGYRERQVVGASSSTKLVEMLPPRLEVLQVQLEEIRLNFRNKAPFEHLSRAENVIEHYSMLLCWLGEIAVWKQNYVNAPKEVLVWSSGSNLLYEERMRCESGIKGAFREQGMSVKFVIYRPGSPMLFGMNAEI